MSEEYNKLAKNIGQVVMPGATGNIETVNIYIRGEKQLQQEIREPLFNVPKLEGSPVFVERNEEIKKITNIILAQKYNKDPLVTALWGPPGYGKTILAKMICYQTCIREHFTGGIFWVEINDSSDEKEELRKLYKDLTGFYEKDINSSSFSQIWKKEPTLVVVDNVETKKKLDLFLSSSGNYCQWLITTQRSNIFDNCHYCKFFKINPLTTEELIVAITTTLIGQEEPNENNYNQEIKEKIKNFAYLLYHWPILLNISLQKIQAMVRHDDSSKIMILNDLIEEITELNLIEFDEDNQIAKSIEKSFKYFDQKEEKYFQELLIFSSDLDIPFSVIRNLWNLPLVKVKRLCHKLFEFSLIKKFSRKKQAIQLDSYIRKYFLSDIQLKEELIHINKKFVEYYANKYNLNSPDNLPNTIPLQEKTFLKRIYRHHWKRAKKLHY